MLAHLTESWLLALTLDVSLGRGRGDDATDDLKQQVPQEILGDAEDWQPLSSALFCHLIVLVSWNASGLIHIHSFTYWKLSSSTSSPITLPRGCPLSILAVGQTLCFSKILPLFKLGQGIGLGYLGRRKFDNFHHVFKQETLSLARG